MKEYIGTKKISAKPMSRGEYNEYRGWDVPEDENPEDLGYLVEYQDGGESNHPAHDGYISWSPKKQFDNAYQDISGGVSFGHAITLAIEGEKIARKEWKSDLWLEFDPKPEQGGWLFHPRLDYHFREENNETKRIPGWFCHSGDMLADDWVVID